MFNVIMDLIHFLCVCLILIIFHEDLLKCNLHIATCKSTLYSLHKIIQPSRHLNVIGTYLIVCLQMLVSNSVL